MFVPGPTNGEIEQGIWDKIFNEFHDPFVRPIKRREDKLVVRVGITYHQLIDVVSSFFNYITAASPYAPPPPQWSPHQPFWPPSQGPFPLKYR